MIGSHTSQKRTSGSSKRDCLESKGALLYLPKRYSDRASSGGRRASKPVPPLLPYSQKRGLHPLSPQSGYLLRTRHRNPTLTHRALPPCFDKKRKERIGTEHVRKQEEKDRNRETQGGKERRRRRTGQGNEKAGTDRAAASAGGESGRFSERQ